MKTSKMMYALFASLFIMAVSFTPGNVYAQTKMNFSMMKDCCMMKDGKMMSVKSGKTMPMKKSMTMKNGTKCMVNGECTMKDGKKMKMKEGECMDMSGTMSDCGMMMKHPGAGSEMKNKKKDVATIYTCTMHPEVTSDKPGNCSKCGMELVKKN